MTDPRLTRLREAALALKEGAFDITVPTEGTDDVAQLGNALAELAQSLESRFEELQQLSAITQQINSGLLLDEILNYVYESFRPIIPYDRIGFSLLEENGTIVRARWARSDFPVMQITAGYSARLEGSSLQTILTTGQPRIINDLEAYLNEHPNSASTHKIVSEGVRSSLTCPLIALGKPIGFMFFSSKRAFTYQNAHNETFTRIAGQLATIVEKGRLYQQLLELNKLKDKFLGMAAHDLRNPLSALRMYLDLFLDGSLGDVTGDQKQIMKDMQGATGTMLALINDLLDVTAIESGHLTLKRESVNLSSFLQELSATHRVHAQSKSISLTFALDESLTTVYLDRDRIRQVMANLISNAIKYSHPHTTITITSQRAGNEAKISVTDQGQGIPKGEMDKLFKEFSKLSVRPTAGEESTGLGLAIVKRMVEAHGGRIWVTSDVGVGSTFGFSLPL